MRHVLAVLAVLAVLVGMAFIVAGCPSGDEPETSALPEEEPSPSEDAAPDWWKLPGKPSAAAIKHREGGCTMIGVRCSYVGECGG